MEFAGVGRFFKPLSLCGTGFASIEAVASVHQKAPLGDRNCRQWMGWGACAESMVSVLGDETNLSAVIFRAAELRASQRRPPQPGARAIALSVVFGRLVPAAKFNRFLQDHDGIRNRAAESPGRLCRDMVAP